MFKNVQTLVHFLRKACVGLLRHISCTFSSFLCSIVSESLGKEWCHVELAVDAWTGKATFPVLHFFQLDVAHEWNLNVCLAVH